MSQWISCYLTKNSNVVENEIMAKGKAEELKKEEEKCNVLSAKKK